MFKTLGHYPGTFPSPSAPEWGHPPKHVVLGVSSHGQMPGPRLLEQSHLNALFSNFGCPLLLLLLLFFGLFLLVYFYRLAIPILTTALDVQFL